MGHGDDMLHMKTDKPENVNAAARAELARIEGAREAREKLRQKTLARHVATPFSNGMGAAVGTVCDVRLLSGLASGGQRRWRVYAYTLMRHFDVEAPNEKAAVDAAWAQLRAEREAGGRMGA